MNGLKGIIISGIYIKILIIFINSVKTELNLIKFADYGIR
jgi:hypothetical protein